MNTVGDAGAAILMPVLKASKSLVYLNLASNEISSVGFNFLFGGMTYNESIVSLNISTMDGANRNRMNKKCLNKFRMMLLHNKFLEDLNMHGVSLGNHGMATIVKALKYGLDESLQKERERREQVYGEFIQSEKHDAKQNKDFTKLPSFRGRSKANEKVVASAVSLKRLSLSYNDINDYELFDGVKVGLNKSSIKELNLSHNKLGDLALRLIFQALNNESSLKRLNLTSTKMTSKGAHSLFLQIQKCHSLKQLTLDQNQLDGAKLKVLRDMLYNNKGLRVLNMN